MSDERDYGRIQANTAEEVNRQIAEELWSRVEALRSAPPEELGHRLRELEKEWDIERTLETNASALTLAGLLLGVLVDRKFLWLSGVVMAFLLQHGVQGWCPPLPIFRRQGVRTRHEIEQERLALKLLRGDFAAVLDGEGTPDVERIRAALER